MKMVLNFMKRKKRTIDVHILNYENENGFEIDENRSDQYKLNIPLTSDTLKRNRRLNRQSYLAYPKPQKNEISTQSGKSSERYKSSPNLFNKDTKQEVTDWNKSISPNILKPTSWLTTGSLITLNLSSDDSQIISEENIVTDDTLAHDESGYYGDSDSGVSSLYETITRQGKIQGSERLNPLIRQQDDEGQCSEISRNSTKHFLQKMDPTLQDIFTRAHGRTIKSHEFSFEFNLLENMYFSTESDGVNAYKTCCKRHLTELLRTRQTLLNQKYSELSEELQNVDTNLANLENELSKSASAGESKLFRRTVDQMSAIVNLVFGLELRLGEASTNSSVLRMRLSEATYIKHRHDDSLLTVGRIVRDRLGISSYLVLRSAVRNKQRVICSARIAKRELYWVETMMKLLFELRL